MVRKTYGGSRAVVRWRKGRGAVDIRGSIFCEVREPVEQPLCEFYASAIRRLMYLFNIDVEVGTDAVPRDGGGPVPDVRAGTCRPYRHAAVKPDTERRAHDRCRRWLLSARSLRAARPRPQDSAQTVQRQLVVPFENCRASPQSYWLTEASAVILTDDLIALGAPAITREDRVRAFERLRVPAVATLSHATVIRLGQLVGAGDAVVGSVEVKGAGPRSSARVRSGSTPDA